MKVDTVERLLRIYADTSTIAVVGCSTDTSKPAHRVPRYLQGQGYRIVPINPREQTILGEQSFDALADVDVEVDLVLVFRPAGEAPQIAAESVRIGARTLWLQTGIVSEEAAGIADEAGVEFVFDACLGTLHGELGLGPGPTEWELVSGLAS